MDFGDLRLDFFGRVDFVNVVCGSMSIRGQYKKNDKKFEKEDSNLLELWKVLRILHKAVI